MKRSYIGAPENHLGRNPDAGFFEKLQRKPIDLTRMFILEKAIKADRQVKLERIAEFTRGIFLQVGAFDGVYDDPIRDVLAKGETRALLVEPQQAAFDTKII